MASWMDETLGEDAALHIVAEILAVQNHSDLLGRALNIPAHIVDAIHLQYSSSRDRLLHVIEEFLKQEEPTWRAIIDALKSPVINFPRLAQKIERSHSSCQDVVQGIYIVFNIHVHIQRHCI